MKFKSKKAAIEMSMTTIVTIVLVVVTLVLALVLIRTIFTSSTNAINQVSNSMQDQINQLFSNSNAPIEVYPATNVITISRGTTPYGFAFSVKNPDPTPANFAWGAQAVSLHDCGSLTLDQAQSFLVSAAGTITVGAGTISDAQGSRVLFIIPSSTPPCTITYLLDVNETAQGATMASPFASQNVYISVQ